MINTLESAKLLLEQKAKDVDMLKTELSRVKSQGNVSSSSWSSSSSIGNSGEVVGGAFSEDSADVKALRDSLKRDQQKVEELQQKLRDMSRQNTDLEQVSCIARTLVDARCRVLTVDAR